LTLSCRHRPPRSSRLHAFSYFEIVDDRAGRRLRILGESA
jgi:hypothetical protein